MTDSLGTINGVGDVSMEAQVLKLLKIWKKKSVMGKKLLMNSKRYKFTLKVHVGTLLLFDVTKLFNEYKAHFVPSPYPVTNDWLVHCRMVRKWFPRSFYTKKNLKLINLFQTEILRIVLNFQTLTGDINRVLIMVEMLMNWVFIA